MSNSVDLQMLIAWAHVLIGAISLVIATIGLRGYWNIKNGKSLRLATAFLIISLSSLIYLPEAFGIDAWPSSLDYVVSGEGQIITALSTIAQSVGFVLLASIYASELKVHIIQFTRVQEDALGVILAVLLVTISYVAIESALIFPVGLLALATFLMATVSTFMLVLISASLFSYWRECGDQNARFIFIGFVSILAYEIYITLSFVPSFSSWIDGVTHGLADVLAIVIGLIGYASFLYAIVRLRVKHGRE